MRTDFTGTTSAAVETGTEVTPTTTPAPPAGLTTPSPETKAEIITTTTTSTETDAEIILPTAATTPPAPAPITPTETEDTESEPQQIAPPPLESAPSLLTSSFEEPDIAEEECPGQQFDILSIDVHIPDNLSLTFVQENDDSFAHLTTTTTHDSDDDDGNGDDFAHVTPSPEIDIDNIDNIEIIDDNQNITDDTIEIINDNNINDGNDNTIEIIDDNNIADDSENIEIVGDIVNGNGIFDGENFAHLSVDEPQEAPEEPPVIVSSQESTSSFTEEEHVHLITTQEVDVDIEIGETFQDISTREAEVEGSCSLFPVLSFTIFRKKSNSL